MTGEADLPFLPQLTGAFAVVLLQIGHRSGLLDAVLAAPGTAEEVAGRAGVDVRNAEEWLRGMTSAGYVEHDGGRFTTSDATATTFGPDFPFDVRSILEGLWSAPRVYDDVVDAVRTGAGIPSERLAPYAPFAGVNTPTYRMTLVDEWIGGLPGLADRLRAGGRVAELAPGNGAAAALVGMAFPASTVVGYDLAPKPATDLPANVSLRAVDARALPDEGPFDLVYSLDSLHHMADPVAVLAGVRAALARGGVVLLAENDFSGDLDRDAADPMSLIAYTSSVVYCLQEALHAGGEVHSCAEGTDWVVDALDRAGFHDVEVRHSETGYALISGIA